MDHAHFFAETLAASVTENSDLAWVNEQAKTHQAVDAYSKLKVKVIIEYCCATDSAIGRVCEQPDDVLCIRLTRERADLSTKRGYEIARDLCEKTSWC